MLVNQEFPPLLGLLSGGGGGAAPEWGFVLCVGSAGPVPFLRDSPPQPLVALENAPHPLAISSKFSHNDKSVQRGFLLALKSTFSFKII